MGWTFWSQCLIADGFYVPHKLNASLKSESKYFRYKTMTQMDDTNLWGDLSAIIQKHTCSKSPIQTKLFCHLCKVELLYAVMEQNQIQNIAD